MWSLAGTLIISKAAKVLEPNGSQDNAGGGEGRVTGAGHTGARGGAGDGVRGRGGCRKGGWG